MTDLTENVNPSENSEKPSSISARIGCRKLRSIVAQHCFDGYAGRVTRDPVPDADRATIAANVVHPPARLIRRPRAWQGYLIQSRIASQARPMMPA